MCYSFDMQQKNLTTLVSSGGFSDFEFCYFFSPASLVNNN